MSKSKEKGFFRLFFAWLWGWIKGNPFKTVVILAAVAVFGLFAAYEVMHLTSQPGFCRLCHAKEGAGPQTEFDTWTKGVHALNGVECLDCHSKQPGAWGYFRAKLGGMYDLGAQAILSEERKNELLGAYEGNPLKKAKLVPSTVCMHCHSDEVYQENIDKHWMTFGGVAMRELDSLTNPEFRTARNMIDIMNDPVKAGVEPNHGMHIALDISCAQCHVSASHSGQFIGNTSMQYCFDCHDQQRSEGNSPVENDDCASCHVTQENLQAGTVAAEFGIEGAEWYMKDLTCSGCHADAFDIPTKESCVDCHEDGYDTMMVDWQTSFDKQKAVALAFIKENIPNQEFMTPMKLEIFHQYRVLYDIVEKDGSRGVHNPDYVMEILDNMDNMRRAFNSLR